MLNIGVVGSRTFKNYDFLSDVLDGLLPMYEQFQVISGGAEGADSLAVRWANERRMPVPIVHPAYWDDLSHPNAVVKTRRNGTKYDAAAGIRRNQLIVDDSDVIVAFMDKKNPTPGTSDTIEKAEAKGIPVLIYWPGE